jgi:hypothetical protein
MAAADDIDPSDMPGAIDPNDMDPQSAIASQGLQSGAQALGQNLESQWQQSGEQIHQASTGNVDALLNLGQQGAMNTVGSIYKVPLASGLELKILLLSKLRTFSIIPLITL